MNKIKNMLKGALALAMVALVGTAEAGQAITFTARTQSKVYDGTALNAAYDITAGSLKTRTIAKVSDKVDSVTYDTNSRTDVGETSYTITGVKIVGGATGWDYTSDYSVTKVGGKLTITPATITSMTLNEPTVRSYTGNPQTVTVGEVKAGNLTLSSSDYDVSGNTATQPGEYTVTVTGKGNYQGAATANWEIKSHEHKWSYATSTDGNVVTLTATCTNPDCTLPSPYQVSATLTLSSGDKAYDGQAITATLDKGEFEATTGITLGDVQCTGNATDVGTYKFSVSADATGCDFSKSVTISARSISDATITLSATSLYYTTADQTVTITSVTVDGLTVDYTEDTDSVRTAKAIGTHTVKITANGNFTGSLAKDWEIVNTPTTSGAGVTGTAVSGGVTAESATAFKVLSADSKKLDYVYDENTRTHTWWATIKLTYARNINSKPSRVVAPWGSAAFTSPTGAKFTVDGTTYSMAEAKQAGGSVNFAHSIATVNTISESYSPSAYYSKDIEYADTISYRVGFSLAEAEAAIKEGRPLTWTINAGAVIETPTSEQTEYFISLYSVAFQDYTVTVPVNETGYTLYDDVGNQVYPAVDYKAQVADTKLKYTTLTGALGAAKAGETVNAIAVCEQADFEIGANVTLNLAGFGAADATYKFVGVTDTTMDAKVVSDKQETVSTDAVGFAVKNDNNTYTIYRAHIHAWEFALDGATLAATCTNNATPCDLPSRTTSIELTVTDNGDGKEPTFAIANQEAFLATVNKFGDIVSIGGIASERLTADGAAKTRWYVGDYRATCVVTTPDGDLTLTNDFSIAKPEGGYKSGWEVGSTGIRYLEADLSIVYNTAADGDTIYYRDGNRDFVTHEFSVGNKNLTFDFGNYTLSNDENKLMTLKNTGSGTLTFQNVVIQQPKGLTISNHIQTEGKIVFGDKVTVKNVATNPDNYLTITVNSGSLIVSNGLYQCGFAKADGATVLLEAGKYWENDKPALGQYDLADRVCREIDGDYKYEIVEHVHVFAYTAEGAVITCKCEGEDAKYCYWNELLPKATLTANDAAESSEPYAGASVGYDVGFIDQTQPITYWQGETQLEGAPTLFGNYTAKLTVGGATAEKAFKITPMAVTVTIPNAANATVEVREGDTVVVSQTEAYSVTHGSKVTAAYTANAGYEPAAVTNVIEYAEEGSSVKAPTFTAIAYGITYELNGGENDPANPATYTVEDAITLKDATKAGYNFTGWAPTNVIEVGSTGAKTFTANWELATVTFTVKAPANASVTKVATNGVELATPYAVLPGTAVTVSYKADAGYLFANGSDTMDAEITVNEAGEQPAPQGTETTEAEAKIGTTYYLTLADALTNAADKATVTVVKDCKVDARINIDPTKSVTLDANEKTITIAEGIYAFVYGGATDTTGDGTLTITGDGTFYAPTADSTCFLWARRGNIVVENGSFSMDGDSQCVYADNGCKATIEDGTFVNRTGVDVLNVNNTRSVVTDIQVSGGSFSKDPATGDDYLKGSFVAEGYYSVKTGEKLWTVQDATGLAAAIDDKGFATLADAFAAAQDGDTVKVLNDCSVAERINIDPTKSITLDANGKTITIAAGVYAFVYGGATETTGEGTFTVKGEGTFYAPTADDTCFLWARRGNIVVENGSFSMDGTAQCVYADNGCTATINGGTFVNRTGADVLNVNNTRSEVEDIQVSGGSFSKDPATGDDYLKGSFVAEGYESKLNEETGLYDVTEKTGPVVVPPVGGDPKETPEIKTVEEGVYEIEVKTNTTTVVTIAGLEETDEVIVPPQINAVNGTEQNPISNDQVRVVADATNGTETVKVDITDAFTIKESGNGVLIELNSNAVVTVEIEGKEPEEIPVTPTLTDAKDAVKPLVIDDTKVATGVKTIPGLTYSLLSGDTAMKIETVVKTIVAEDTRVVLEAAKTADPAKFYKIQVAK